MQPHIVAGRRRASTATSTSTSAQKLPRLPVPDLHQSLQSYVKSLEPIILEHEARGGPTFQDAYNARLKLAEDFESGIGRTCQRRLLELDAKSPHNWLDDNIWLKKVYHEWRAPLIVNSNWWLALLDDPIVPSYVRYSGGPRRGYTTWQVRRAAWLVHRILEFKAQLEQKDLPPSDNRSGVWFRHAALQSFNKCRIPQPGCDVFSPEVSSDDPNGRKLLVVVDDWMYAVDVINADGQAASPAIIEKRLRAVVEDVMSRRAAGQSAVPVGVLTTDDRDQWAKNLHRMLSPSPVNRATFHTIKASVFSLSLDDYSYFLPSSYRTPDLDLAAHLHNIRSGHGDRPGHNRWYDKPFTLIVEANTRTGVLGEHSPVDALVPSVVADYAIVQGVVEDEFPNSLSGDVWIENSPSSASVGGWERLDWEVDEAIAKECVEAARRAKAIVDDSDMDELVFNAYGTAWIKNKAGLSPDAYVQMAMQLAWYRTRGEFTATYETALTRLFDRGRTETIRTLSADSRAWVLGMCDPHCDNQTRLDRLRRAIQTHTGLTRRAATGRGFDRHLLGLRLMLQPDAGESHPIFEDPLFSESQTWKLSTSGLSAGHQFRGTGFGAPYNDGYGINYMSAPEKLRFGIESKNSCSDTSTQHFMVAISDALLDMQQLCTPILQSHL